MKKLNNKKIIFLLTLMLVVMSAVPAMAGVQPTVDLGTSSSFAVLAGSTITNTGNTAINGDAGANIGVYPGTVITEQASLAITNGAIYLAGDVAKKAKDDLQVAYNDAAGRTPVIRIDSELGGTTLKPGVYDSADGTFQITGTLILDGNNETEPVFIFKTASTLITASDSKINLINGARYCRTFWQVGSSATLGTNSHFVGHIFAMQSITVTTDATVQGQLLALNGAVTLDNNTITNGFCETPLPNDGPDDDDEVIQDDDEVIQHDDEDDDEVTQEDDDVAQEDNEVTPEDNEVTPEVIEAPEVIVHTTVTGGELPNTSTPWTTILFAGLGLMIIGAVSLKIIRKYE